KTLVCWKLRPRPRRERRSGAMRATSRPPRRIVPAVGRSVPERRLMSVDLPAPLGPRTAWRTPRQRSMSTSRTAGRPPKSRRRPRASRRTSATRSPPQAGEPAGEKQDERDDGEPHRQLPVLGERREDFLETDEGERAGEAAAQAPDAAEDQHEEDVPRLL